MVMDGWLTVNGDWLMVNGNGRWVMEMGKRLMVTDNGLTVNGPAARSMKPTGLRTAASWDYESTFNGTQLRGQNGNKF